MRGIPNRTKGWWYQENNWSYSWTTAHALQLYLNNSTQGLKARRVSSVEELKEHFEEFKIYMRGHNLYDIFYARFREQETELLRNYLQLAPREDFKDILDAIDSFVYFDSHKRKSSD